LTVKKLSRNSGNGKATEGGGVGLGRKKGLVAFPKLASGSLLDFFLGWAPKLYIRPTD
jgi:hypothetical protein